MKILQMIIKNLLIVTLSAAFYSSLFAQSPGVSISEEGTEPDPSAMLDVMSTDKGFLPPRMNSVQRMSISAPAEGLVIYNTDINCLEFFDGSVWYNLCGDLICQNPAGIPIAEEASELGDYEEYQFTANWQEGTEATSYTLEVSTEPSFSTFEFQENVEDVLTFNVINLTPSPSYYYRVSAENLCGQSDFSEIISVNVPEAPVALSPIFIGANEITASWESSSGAVSYILQVSEHSNFSSFVFNENVGGELFYTVDNLNSGTEYHYRVIAANLCGFSDPSNIISVTPIWQCLIGVQHQGGIIAYISEGEGSTDPASCSGFVAEIYDECEGTGPQWGCAWQSVGAPMGTEIGTGASNTATILNYHDNVLTDYYNNPTQCNSNNDGTVAAKFCADKTGEYSDWFLPSRDELLELYNNLHTNDPPLGNFDNFWYWSSSESAPNSSRQVNFSNGNQATFDKIGWYRVRCIRYF